MAIVADLLDAGRDDIGDATHGNYDCETFRIRLADKWVERVAALLVPEICICSALLMADGFIVRGHRHDDCLMTASGYKRYVKGDLHAATQGFLTTRNRFVDRAEGLALQLAAGIPSAHFGGEPRGDILFSEDLY